jgi:membrane protease YdiL (CAAX protease family)
MTEMQPVGRSLLARIFISPDQPRLRAGWRLLIQTILFIGFGILLTLLLQFLNLWSWSESLIVGQLLNMLVITASVYIARRWLDRQSFESLGLKWDMLAFYDILKGIGITFVQMGFIFLVMLGLGWLTFKGFAWDFDPVNTIVISVLNFLVVFIIVGWNEELLSRGYHLQTIASGLNLFWGVVISSAVFGLLHLGNPNATWVSAAGIFFAGVYLAYAYVRTGKLWLSIGLHIGWNFFEGVVFGFPVSGLTIYPLTRILVTGPVLWTGGAFGPEAGLIVLPSLIVGGLLIYWVTQNRK